MEPQLTAPAITGLQDPEPINATLEQSMDFSLGQSLAATAASTFVSNPAMAVRDLYEYGADRTGFMRDNYLTAEAANQQYGHIGLSFNRPVSRYYADILAEQKRQENVRSTIDTYGPQGVGATALKFGVGLGVSALDPINIASAFIPPLGATRLIAATGVTGNLATRAITGAVGGAIGAAAVEPLVYAGAQARQADYDLTDSLLNITFGTILGGGIHALGGYVNDRFINRQLEAKAQGTEAPRPTTQGEVAAALPAETRETVIRTAIGQAVEGQAINVTPIMRPAVKDVSPPLPDTLAKAEATTIRAESRAPSTPEATAPANIEEANLIRQDVPEQPFNRNDFEQVRAITGERVTSLNQRVKELGGIRFDGDYAAELKDIADGRRGVKLQLGRKNGRALDDLALELETEGYIKGRYGERATPDDLLQALEQEASGNRVYPQHIEDMLVEAQYQSGWNNYADRVYSDTIDGDSMASKSHLAEAERVISEKEAELDESIGELEQMLKGMGKLTEAEQASLAEADGFIDNQPTIREAIRAAAACVIGK